MGVGSRAYTGWEWGGRFRATLLSPNEESAPWGGGGTRLCWRTGPSYIGASLLSPPPFEAKLCRVRSGSRRHTELLAQLAREQCF